MNEQYGFDQPAEPVGPEIDNSGNPTDAAPEQGERPKAPAGREMLVQLQQMIDNIAYQAAPVVREVGAKAAELAAIAGTKAGPIAHKAADVTEQFGQRVAARSSAMAADLRKPREDADATEATEATADTEASDAMSNEGATDMGSSSDERHPGDNAPGF